MSKLAFEYLRRALTASVYEVARRTPLERALNLSARLGAEVYFKREDLQPTFSFKIRGAYAHIKRLSENCRKVVAASAGNHAQGVALAARERGLEAHIVMPRTTPGIKVDAVRRLGARVVLAGDGYDDAEARAREIAAEIGAVLIHPFDDPDVIAGQGTVGLELLNQSPAPPAMVFVPVGGGGLIAGIAAVIKSLHPQTQIVGVEPEDAACLAAARAAGAPVTLERAGIFVDGAAVRRIGDLTFELARELVDSVVTVSADEICAAMRDVFEDTRALVEPAGALAVAGIKAFAKAHEPLPAGPIVAINSGANINFSRLGHVVERAAIGRGEELLLAVTIPERPGSFLKFLKTLGHRGIREFNYRYRDPDAAEVFVGLSLEHGARTRAAGAQADLVVLGRLREAGYSVVDLSHNEMARLHLRHMVGGTLPSTKQEQIYRFEFPERPGALLDFLSTLAGRWNISLFHYRNHGAAYGRVLAGFMVPDDEGVEFQRFLDSTGYPWIRECDNPAYLRFLSPPPAFSRAAG